jgi:hypothetical protein
MKEIFERAVDAEAHKDFETRRAEHGADATAVHWAKRARQRNYWLFVAGSVVVMLLASFAMSTT